TSRASPSAYFSPPPCFCAAGEFCATAGDVAVHPLSARLRPTQNAFRTSLKPATLRSSFSFTRHSFWYCLPGAFRSVSIRQGIVLPSLPARLPRRLLFACWRLPIAVLPVTLRKIPLPLSGEPLRKASPSSRPICN